MIKNNTTLDKAIFNLSLLCLIGGVIFLIISMTCPPEDSSFDPSTEAIAEGCINWNRLLLGIIFIFSGLVGFWIAYKLRKKQKE